MEGESSDRSDDKPHTCSVCGCGFSRSLDLARHMHRHTGEKLGKVCLCPSEVCYDSAHRDMMDQLSIAEEFLQKIEEQEARDLFVGLMESIMEEVVEKYTTIPRDTQKNKKGANNKDMHRAGKNSGAKKRWARKKATYRNTQLLYTRDRRRLARQIMGAPAISQCPLSKEELEQCFMGKLAVANGKANINKMVNYTGNTNYELLMEAIVLEEVEEALNGTKTESAAGLDGMHVEDIQNIMNEEETLIPRLFTLWLKSAIIPTNLKKSRTVLIPKTEDSELLKDIDNWRPITIGPMLLRLFTKIMAKRLSSAVEINPRQKGFIAETPGCNENIVILQNIIKGAKQNKKELAIVFVDLAKAFDSVGHRMLSVGLKRMGLPGGFIRLIECLYTDNTTIIEGDRIRTDPIPIRRGVKQGDPLSPLLFNITMDPLICTLEKAQKGVLMNYNSKTINCSALAFADDVAILSDSYQGMNTNLRILQDYCENTGLQINIKKTAGFHFSCSRKTFMYNCEKNWTIDRNPISYIAPGGVEKYLGARIDPWSGVAEDKWSEKLKLWLESLKHVALKPTQKIEIMKTFIIPRLYDHLILVEASQNTLIKLDQIIKKATKDVLHLPAETTDGLLYAKHKDGGLGIPKLEIQIPSAIIQKLEALEKSDDIVIGASFAYCEKNNIENIRRLRDLKILREIEDFLGNDSPQGNEQLRLPTIYEESDAAVAIQEGVVSGQPAISLRERVDVILGTTKTREKPTNRYSNWRNWEFTRWENLLCQGAGIRYYRDDQVSNSWINIPQTQKQSKYIMGLLLRCNLYPTRYTLSYGRKNAIKVCRKCQYVNETIAHISGMCPAVKNARIKRHNKIMDLLKNHVSKYGWKIYIEPRLRSQDDRLWKPDLVFVKGSDVAVVDVTIRYEDNHRSLELAWAEKAMKYQHLGPQIATLTSGTSIRYFGFVMGARGKWLEKNNALMKFLNIERYNAFSKQMSRLTISLTLELLQIFNNQ